MDEKKDMTAAEFARRAQLVVYVDSREQAVELGSKVQEALAGLGVRLEIRLGAAPLRIGSYSK